MLTDQDQQSKCLIYHVFFIDQLYVQLRVIGHCLIVIVPVDVVTIPGPPLGKSSAPLWVSIPCLCLSCLESDGVWGIMGIWIIVGIDPWINPEIEGNCSSVPPTPLPVGPIWPTFFSACLDLSLDLSAEFPIS